MAKKLIKIINGFIDRLFRRKKIFIPHDVCALGLNKPCPVCRKIIDSDV